MYNKLRAAKEVGSKKVGAHELAFDEILPEGQVRNRTQEREDLLEVLAGSPADALKICREKRMDEQRAVQRSVLWKV